MSKLNEILTSLALSRDDEPHKIVAEARHELDELLYQLIGYEQTTSQDGRTFISAADGIRNELRTELRRKVPEL